MIFDQQSQSPDPGILDFPNFPFTLQPDQGVGPGPVVILSTIIKGNTDQTISIQGNVDGVD
jgi:hypothetical protein